MRQTLHYNVYEESNISLHFNVLIWCFLHLVIILSYGVAIIQWVTSCHKNDMTTHYITFFTGG